MRYQIRRGRFVIGAARRLGSPQGLSLINRRSAVPGYGRGAGVGRALGDGLTLGVGVGRGVGVAVGVGVCVGVAVAVALAVGVKVAVGVAVAVALGEAVGVGVGLTPEAQYLPPVLNMFRLNWPPQMIISLSVHTAV